MAFKNVFLILVMACLFMAYATAATSPGLNNNNLPGDDLAARLADSQGQVMECWKALQGLMSCSTLTVQFFLTGRADVAACCTSIEIVTAKCSWPSPMTSLGYTAAESNILRAFCGAVPAPPPGPKNAPPPPAPGPKP